MCCKNVVNMQEVKVKIKDKFLGDVFRMQKGDLRAGDRIFHEFSPHFFRFFLLRTMNREAAEDLTQQVFIKIIQKISSFDKNKGLFSSWAWQIARNSLKDYYKKKKSLSLNDFFEGQIPNLIENNDNVINKIKLAEVLREVRKLSGEEQEVFSLHYLSDLPYRKMSRILGKSENALRVMIYRINRKIRKVFNN